MQGYYIYVHTNKKNGAKYVGITTQNPKQRWANGSGYSTQKKFYNAILKYGWDNFDHQVWEVGSMEDMLYGEQYLIKYWDTIKNGYNVSSGGKNPLYPDRQKGESRRWRKDKQLLQISKDGKVIKRWSCVVEVCEELGHNYTAIQQCVKGRTKSAYGYYWKYK